MALSLIRMMKILKGVLLKLRSAALRWNLITQVMKNLVGVFPRGRGKKSKYQGGCRRRLQRPLLKREPLGHSRTGLLGETVLSTYELSLMHRYVPPKQTSLSLHVLSMLAPALDHLDRFESSQAPDLWLRSLRQNLCTQSSESDR